MRFQYVIISELNSDYIYLLIQIIYNMNYLEFILNLLLQCCFITVSP